jgi:hypothetical protein
MIELLSKNDAFEATLASPGVVLVRITSRPLGVFTIDARRQLTAFLQSVHREHGARCVVLIGTGASFSRFEHPRVRSHRGVDRRGAACGNGTQ